MADVTAQGSQARLLGYACIVSSALLFGVAGTVAKLLFVDSMPPLVMIALRAVVASATLALVMAALRKPIRIRRADAPFLLELGVWLTLVNVTFFYAIALTNVALALMLEYTAPMLIVAAGVILGTHRLNRPVVLILAGNAAGCFLLVGGYDPALWSGNALGAAVGLLCAVSFAAYNVRCADGHRRGLDSWSMTFWPFFLSALFWLLATPAIDYSAVEFSWGVVGFTLFVGVFGTVVPYWLYLEGLRTIDPFPATVVGMLDPVFAGLTAYALLGERFDPPQVAGMALVCAVIVYLKRNEAAVNQCTARGCAGPPSQPPPIFDGGWGFGRGEAEFPPPSKMGEG